MRNSARFLRSICAFLESSFFGRPVIKLFTAAAILLASAAQAQTYSQVQLTGFNADVIANGPTLTGSVTADVDGGGYYFLDQTFTQFGAPPHYLPSSGLINNAITPALTYQLASATGNNSMRLTTASPTGTLTFVTPANAGVVYLLGASGNGPAIVTVTVNFTDATSQTFADQSVLDWFNGATAVIQGIGRTTATGLDANSATTPRLFQIPLQLTGANVFKQIASISFNKTSPGTNNIAQIMAVSLGAPCTIPAAQPTALTLTAAGPSQINGSFTAASPAPDQYLVVRYPAGATPTTPLNGVSYTAGNTLGAGTVLQSGTATSFTSTGLSISTSYDFYIYSFNNTSCFGPVYATASPLTGTQATTSCGGPSGVVTVGPTATYPTLTAAFSALTPGISGSVVFELQSNYVSTSETYPIVLTPNVCVTASRTITIRPASGATGLTIASTNSAPTIDFNGTKYVTIDGRPGGTGTASQLSVINTSATGAAVRFINDARYNKLTYLDMQGQNTSSTSSSLSGVVYFSTAATNGQGNDYDTLSFCSVHATAGGNPAIGICNYGTNTTVASYNDSVVLMNNNIYDFFIANNASTGIKVDVGGNAWTIANNSLYQTATRTYTSGNTHRGFWITPNTGSIANSASGFIITGNYIGGSAASAGGTAYTMAGSQASVFQGMDISVGVGAATSIQGNTITNMNVTTTSTSNPSFAGISVANGNVNLGTVTANTIGSASQANAITLLPVSSSGGTAYGLRIGSGNTINVSNNIVGGINIAPAANIAHNFIGIGVTGANTINLKNNIVGGFANSIVLGATASGVTQSATGISISGGTATSVDGNTVSDITNNYTGTSNSSSTRGIVVTTSASSITNNTVRNLTTSAPANGGGATSVLVGIAMTSTSAGVDVTGNTIHSLSLTSASTTATANLTGIFYGGSSSYNENVSNNFIHSFDFTGTNTSVTLTGIDYSGGAVTFANNMIRLGIRPDGTSLSTEATVRGISSNSSSTVNNFYFNSIYIGGTGVGTAAKNSYAFIRTSTSGTYDIRNNIFANVRSNATTGGKHYAVFFTTSMTGVNIDYNLYQYSGTGGVFANSGSADVPAYVSGWTAFDRHSLVGDPFFVNATGAANAVNLHVQAGTPAEGTGIAIPAITNDFDNQVRASLSPTDIGADAGDYGTPGVDVGATALVAPATGVCYGTGMPVTVRLRNFSSTTINFATNPVTVTVTATGPGAPYTSTITLNTGTLAAGATMDVTLPTLIDMSAAGTYTFNASATSAADANSINNAIASETRTVTTGASLGGTYTVGSGGSYPTLTAAVAAYNTSSCLSGNVVFSLTDPTYSTNETFPIVINSIAGGGSNTLTIRPAAGNAATITGTSGTTASALIRLNGADNVTIDGINTGGSSLTIENTSTTAGTAVVWLNSGGIGNGATNNVIRNLTVKGGIAQTGSTSSTYGIVIAGNALNSSIGSVTAGDDNDNNIIENNNVIKVRYGIYTRGGSSQNANQGTIIRNNLVGPAAFGTDEIGLIGIISREEENLQITGNEIRFVGGDYANSPSAGTQDRAGIVLGTDATWTPSSSAYVKNALISGNKIHDIVEERTYSALGIILEATNGTAPTNITVANNMIWNVKANGTGGDQTVGIGLGFGYGVKVDYNTIYMTGDTDPSSGATATSTAGFGISVYSASVVNPEIKNNIVYMDLFSSSAPTLRFSAINVPSGYSWGSGGSDYNDFYVDATNTTANIGTVGGSSGTYYNTLAGWQGATAQDQHSVSVKPAFNSASDLHLIPGLNIALSNLGTPIAGITTDIDGDTRDASTPDMGADEFVVPAGVDIATSTLVAPVVRSCYSNAETVSVSIKNLSANVVSFSATPVTVTANVTGATTATLTKIVNTGTLNPGDSLIVTFATTLDMSAIGTYTFNATSTTPADVNAANNAMQPVTRTLVAVNAGTVTSSVSTLCQTGVPTLTLAGNAGGNVQWQESSSATGPWSNAGTGGQTYTPATPITANTYYQAVVSCNANNATTTPVLVTVNNPQVLTSTPATRCGPGTVTLQATGSAGVTLNWYTAATGGTPVGTGTSFTTPVLAATTTYYVAAEIGTPACVSTRTAVAATINAGPAFTVSSNTTICNSGIATLSVTSPAANFDTYSWTPTANLYTNSGATTAYSGGSATTLYFKNTTPGTYTFVVSASNTTSQCAGVDSIKVTVLPSSLTATASPAQLCVSGQASLSLVPPSVLTGATFQWSSSPDGVSFAPIAGANSATYQTPTLNATQYYLLEVKASNGSTCFTPTTSVTVNNPQVLTTTPGANCGTGTVTLQATGSAGTTLNWYTTSTGGTPVGTGASFTTPSITATTTYYVAASAATTPGKTVGAGASTSTSYESPYYHFYGGKRSQYLIRAADLTSAGITAGNLTSLAFNVVATGTSYNSFKIGLKQTTATDMTSTLETGLTTVYTAPSVTPVVGINNYDFFAPFAWDGTSNLIVEVCWSNNNTGGANATVKVDATSYVSHAYYRQDSQDPSVICGTNAATATQNTRPQMIFNGQTPCASPRVAVAATINSATVIATQPASQSVCPGTNVTFTVGATGAGLTYQWMKGTTNITGATNASYTISNVSATDAGAYTVVVTGTCGTLTSSVANLVVSSANGWIGVVSTDWSNAANWCGGIPTSTTDVLIPAGTPFSPIVNGTASVHNLTIATGATVSTTAGATMNIYGNFSNSGTFTSPSGFIYFRGTAAQTVSAITAANIVVNNTAGITLNGNMTATTLILQAGNVTLGSNNLTVSGSVNGSVSSHIVTNGTGKVTSNNIGAGPVIIPVASDATSYNPVIIANGQGLNYTVSVATGVNPAITDNTKAINRTWTVTPSATPASNVTMTLQFADAQGNSGFVPNTLVEIGQYNGSSWRVITPTNGVTPLGTATDRQATVVTTQFGPLVVTTPGGITYVTAVPTVNPDITGVLLMPNPVQSRAVLRVTTRRALKMNFTISDAGGRNILTLDKQLAAGTNDIELELSRLASGVYFIRGVNSAGKIDVIKFIKL